jgi:hypothetical protein
MTSPSKIFVEISVTNKEFMKVLTQIGFRNESNTECYRFVNDKYNSIVRLPVRPLDEAVQRIDVAGYSYQLYMQGVIRDEENLVKKVLQNRAKRKTAVAA